MKKMKTRLIGIMVAILALCSLTGCGAAYNGAIENLLAVTYAGDVSKLEKLAPDAYWEKLEEGLMGVTLEEVKEQYKKVSAEKFNLYDYKIGDFEEYSFEVKEETEMTEDTLTSIRKSLSKEYDMEEDSVKQGFEVEVRFTITGSNGSYTERNIMDVINVDGSWYIYDSETKSFYANAIVVTATLGKLGDLFD